MAEKIIFTCGTGLRSEEDFIEILMSYEISSVIDVRSYPKSRMPHFNRDSLHGLLGQNGLSYHFLGRELGGLRKGGYAAYALTGEFLAGIEKVEQIASEKRSVIICAERFPWKCHRRWIARELQRRGWTIEHIIDKGKVWVPR